MRKVAAAIFTPCPATRDADVRASLAQLAQAGASVVTTPMPAVILLEPGMPTEQLMEQV